MQKNCEIFESEEKLKNNDISLKSPRGMGVNSVNSVNSENIEVCESEEK